MADDFREIVAMQNDLGVDSEALSPSEAERHLPRLQSDTYAGATNCATDGSADPHLGL